MFIKNRDIGSRLHPKRRHSNWQNTLGSPPALFFCRGAGALRGGERPHEGVTEDLPLSNDGMKCMDPVATLQDDVKGNALEWRKRGKAEGRGMPPPPLLYGSGSFDFGALRLRSGWHSPTTVLIWNTPFLPRFRGFCCFRTKRNGRFLPVISIWHGFCLCMGVKNRPVQIDSRAARI